MIRPTSVLTTAALGGVLVWSFRTESKLPRVRNLERAILTVATAQYAITFKMSDARLQRWRYLDWLITTPLLLRTFFELAKARGYAGNFELALTFDIIMIVAGYFAEYPELSPWKSYRSDGSLDLKSIRNLWYAVSFTAMLIILQQVFKWNQFLTTVAGVDTKSLPYFFYLGWSAYAVNFFNPSEPSRQGVFDILDLFNKAVYSLALDNVIQESF